MEDFNKNPILHTNILYFVLGILLITLGSKAQGREVYSGLLITEYIIIFIPNLIYLKSKGLSLKKTLRLNKISFKQIVYVIGITIFTYPIAVFLNLILLLILGLFGELSTSSAPIPTTGYMYLISLFVIAISPGICEEIMFRGTIMNAYEGLSKKKAIIYSAVLFGLFHLNLQNLVGPILLGIVFGIIVYKTNSIYSSIIAHTINNGIALTIGYLTFRGNQNLVDTGVTAPEISFELQMAITILVVGIIALISYFILVNLIKKLPESNEGTQELEINTKIEEDIKFKFIQYLPVLGIILLFIIINYKFLYL